MLMSTLQMVNSALRRVLKKAKTMTSTPCTRTGVRLLLWMDGDYWEPPPKEDDGDPPAEVEEVYPIEEDVPSEDQSFLFPTVRKAKKSKKKTVCIDEWD